MSRNTHTQQARSHPPSARCRSLTRTLVWKSRGQTVKQLHRQLINQMLTAIQLSPGSSSLLQTSEQGEGSVFNSDWNCARCIIAPCRACFNPAFNRYRNRLKGRDSETVRMRLIRFYLKPWLYTTLLEKDTWGDLLGVKITWQSPCCQAWPLTPEGWS